MTSSLHRNSYTVRAKAKEILFLFFLAIPGLSEVGRRLGAVRRSQRKNFSRPGTYLHSSFLQTFVL